MVLKIGALENLKIIDIFRSIYVVTWQQHASVWMKSTYWNKTTFFAQNTYLFPNLEKLFEEKTTTWNMVLFEFTLKSCFNLIESFIFLWFYSYFGRISLISSFSLKQINGLELLCPSQHFSTLTDADIMLKPVLTCIFICHVF